MNLTADLHELSRKVRHFILLSTTEAQSGHPTSSLSATDLMTVLFFKYLKSDLKNFQAANNDRVIFSKGHAAPLLYALYAAADEVSMDELKSLRRLGSPLEGHPTPNFKFAEVASGSLGQGLSIGLGMALNAKYLDKSDYKTFMLLGDGEMAEGSVWETLQSAAHYKLDNLVAILDQNRFGQSQQTMVGDNTADYERKISAFGWETLVIDGHSLNEIDATFQKLLPITGKPKMIIARTVKGKGVSFFERQTNWHGKPLPKEELANALREIGPIDTASFGTMALPSNSTTPPCVPFNGSKATLPRYEIGQMVATRKAYGEALAACGAAYPELVALDGDTKNSTYSEIFAQKYPERFFEMYIAEQNMVGAAVGLSKRGKVPFLSTFAAFLTRTYDQVRMAAVSQANIKICGSHAGVSIGEDGSSQMGLEDLAMFRAVCNSVVLYPSCATQTAALVEQMARHKGIAYMRTSRPNTPVLYSPNEHFSIGGSKVLKQSAKDALTVIGVGITVHEALKAYSLLQGEGISIRVIDCYSVKPIDEATLRTAARETSGLIVVEDHWFEGGLGDAVLNVFARKRPVPIVKLAVRQMPTSGKPDELVHLHGLSAAKIVEAAKSMLSGS